MKPLLSILSFVSIALIMNGCGFGVKAKTAEPIATKFYEILQSKEYNKLEAIMDESAGSKDEWMAVIDLQNEVLGDLKSFDKKLGFNTSINNGITSVELNYECQYENAVTDETLYLKQGKKGFKVTGYEYKARQ